jgi:endonuclease YncB( thermonuclease family)
VIAPLALALLLAVVPAPFSGRVVAVHDGDTISVRHDRQMTRVRLHGIDCPEGGQPFGKAAKKAASSLAFDREVRVVPQGLDRYGRTVAVVFVGSMDLGLELVRRGYAWHYVRYSSDTRLAAAQEAARRQRLGLWVDPSPQAPWLWRASHGPR